MIRSMEPDAGALSFDPSEPSTGVVGDPIADAALWRRQSAPGAGGVAVQGFVLDGIAGVDVSERDLLGEAERNGWCTPGAGTPLAHLGALLAARGLAVEHHEGASIDDIDSALMAGLKVIVPLEADAMTPAGPAVPLHDARGQPGNGAERAVQVIGIDWTHRAGPQVVLNDPADPAGRGRLLSTTRFTEAWDASGRHLVCVTVPRP